MHTVIEAQIVDCYGKFAAINMPFSTPGPKEPKI